MDPDTWRNFTEIITSKGYPCEYHEVITTDGYILGTFRIPHGRNSQTKGRPVLLFHGLMDNSITWIINMPHESLAYILADQGFDVWMGNVRGNIYSTNHVNIPPTSPQFWDFSFDEFARYDLPETVDYILAATGYKTLSYIGHSQGTTMTFAAFNIHPHYASKLNLFVGLGPVASVKNIENKFLKFLADWDIDLLIQYLGAERFGIPSDSYLGRLIESYFCYMEPQICANVVELICGQHQNAFNNSRMPVVSTHEPGGTSVKNVIHWAQLVRRGLFAMYDYGIAGNLKVYNSTAPPVYKLDVIPSSLPLALVYGDKDLLADPIDVRNLIKILSNSPVYVKELKNYAHLDFCWCIEAYSDFYRDIVALVQKYNRD
jgi:pimeloyl-ACP methyl ester carboxylesterase